MKTKLSLILAFSAAVLVFALVSSARGQSPATLSDGSAGLIGQTWSGVEVGYVHHVEGAPRALHRLGFVSSRPLLEDNRFDAAFRYDYTRGNAFGRRGNQHDVAMSFVGYLPLPEAKPFLRADLGWTWSRIGGVRDSGLSYLVGGGVEVRMAPRVALTPFLNYREFTQLHERAWIYGARLTRRFNVGWSGSFTLQLDDQNNIEYAAGLQRRF